MSFLAHVYESDIGCFEFIYNLGGELFKCLIFYFASEMA